jgi:hypothetical protein
MSRAAWAFANRPAAGEPGAGWSRSVATLPVGADRRLEVGEVVDEREVDDPVAAGRPGPQSAQVVQVTAERLGSGGGDGGGRGLRPGEPEDLVTRAEKFGDDGRADPAGRAGDEYPHGGPPDR